MALKDFFAKKPKTNPQVERINQLLEKLEINLKYFRTDKSKRYYSEIKDLYRQLPKELVEEKKLIISKLEGILERNKDIFSSIPQSEYISNSWTINLKEFAQPTREKLLILFLVFVAANLPNIGVSQGITGLAFNPLFYPSFATSPIASWKLFGSAVYLTTSILYWYALICLVLFILKKVKK